MPQVFQTEFLDEFENDVLSCLEEEVVEERRENFRALQGLILEARAGGAVVIEYEVDGGEPDTVP